MDREKNKQDKRPEAYPRPTETDQQLRNQPEFIDEQPNDFSDKSVSDIPGTAPEKLSNDPREEADE